MLFELRQYTIVPGYREEWVRLMEEEIIPLQVAKGMVILGSWVAEEDETTYIWLRRFRDEEERKALYEAVYQCDEWKTSIGPRIPGMMEREKMKVTRMIATPKSPIQ